MTDKTLPYSTVGGQVTRGETYAQLMDYIKQAQDHAQSLVYFNNPETYIKLTNSLDMAREAAAVIGHLHNTEDTDADQLMAKGWLGIAEFLKLIRWKITRLATVKPTQNQWAGIAKTFEGIAFQIKKLYERRLN